MNQLEKICLLENRLGRAYGMLTASEREAFDSAHRTHAVVEVLAGFNNGAAEWNGTPTNHLEPTRIYRVRFGSRSHEECYGCQLRQVEPRACYGHPEGPTRCPEFTKPLASYPRCPVCGLALRCINPITGAHRCDCGWTQPDPAPRPKMPEPKAGYHYEWRVPLWYDNSLGDKSNEPCWIAVPNASKPEPVEVNRTHEECASQHSLPPKCPGHVSGETRCRMLVKKTGFTCPRCDAALVDLCDTGSLVCSNMRCGYMQREHIQRPHQPKPPTGFHYVWNDLPVPGWVCIEEPALAAAKAYASTHDAHGNKKPENAPPFRINGSMQELCAKLVELERRVTALEA